MSGYPGQGYQGQGYGQGYPAYPGYPPQGGYQQPPPPPPPGYGGYPPQQPQYGGYQYPPQGGYPPPQGHYPPPAQYPPQGHYPPPQQGQRGHEGNYQHQAPPQGFQQFGHGAPSDYGFQYSQCTGKRKALLIGINYFGQKGELRGCINDVRNLSNFLMEFYGYRQEDMVQLTDDSTNPQSMPTKDNIIRAMHWLVADAQPNDSLFFHFSGHGSQTEDLDGDEDDGYDETIVPLDYEAAGQIVDDDMHDIMVKPLPPGCRLTAIFDSCHSGTALDLPYVYSTQGVLKEPNLAKEAGVGLLGAVTSYARGDMGGVASSLLGFAKSAFSDKKARETTMRTKTSPADVISFSGSKDDQTSADATIANQATGAMSHAFVSALRANRNVTYLQLLNAVRDILRDEYSQKPQLSCSHPLDTENVPFVM